MRRALRSALYFLPAASLLVPLIARGEKDIATTLILVLYLMGTYLFTASIYSTAESEGKWRWIPRGIITVLCIAEAVWLYIIDPGANKWVTIGFLLPIALTLILEVLVTPTKYELAVTTARHTTSPRRFIGWFGPAESRTAANELKEHLSVRYPNLNFAVAANVQHGYADETLNDTDLRREEDYEMELLKQAGEDAPQRTLSAVQADELPNVGEQNHRDRVSDS